ncbi:MAG: M23 family metallopeptidase [candidate division Zixibacteria bacterium]
MLGIWNKRLTLLVIPDSQGESRQISIRMGTLYSCALLVIGLAVSAFFFAGKYVSGLVVQQEFSRMEGENERLRSRFEKVRWDLAEADSRYQDLVQKEVALRIIFDLPQINTDERKRGIGGPGGKNLYEMTPVEKLAYSTEIEVDRLLRLSAFELERYDEVEAELTSLKDRLDHTPSIWPTRGWLSRGYGQKHDPFTGYKQLHRGMDVANNSGTQIIATADGRVKSTGTAGSLGKMVVIDHGYGYSTRYGHLSKALVKRGQKVKRGEVIALMGNTGYSTGPHLHYEVWRSGKVLNPRNYILNQM